MKKRKGFIRYDFNGEVVYVPIDPDKRAIPGSYWEAEDGSKLFSDPKPTAENVDQWWEAQEQLEEMAKQKGRKTGAKKSTAKRTETSNTVNAWLYPMLAVADSALIEDGIKQRGPLTLQKSVLENDLEEGDERRGLVTPSRIKAWIRKGRPDHE